MLRLVPFSHYVRPDKGKSIMKNPKVPATLLQESVSHSLTFLEQIKDGELPAGVGGISNGKGDPTDDSQTDYKGLEKFLQTLKFTDEEIGRITALVGTVAALVS